MSRSQNMEYHTCVLIILHIDLFSFNVAYRDENGKPWVLPVVRRTEKQMAEDDSLLHEYLPVLGKNRLMSSFS